MRLVLQFAYTDQIEECMIDSQILIVADKYQFKRLKAICEKYLARCLTLANFVDVAIDTFHCGSKTYQNTLAKFISQNWAKITTGKKMYLMKFHPDLYVKVITFLNLGHSS